jgi:hypothetical protein
MKMKPTPFLLILCCYFCIDFRIEKDRLFDAALDKDNPSAQSSVWSLAKQSEYQILPWDLSSLKPLLDRRRGAEIRLLAVETMMRERLFGPQYVKTLLNSPDPELRLIATTGFLYERKYMEQKSFADRLEGIISRELFGKEVGDEVKKGVAERIMTETDGDTFHNIKFRMMDSDVAAVRTAGASYAELDEAGFQKLCLLTKDEDREVRWGVVFRLEKAVEFDSQKSQALPILRRALLDNNVTVAENAVHSVMRANDVFSVPLIMRKTTSTDYGMWLTACQAVVALTGAPFNFSGPRTDGVFDKATNIHGTVLLDDPEQVKKRQQQERVRLLKWWKEEGTVKYIRDDEPTQAGLCVDTADFAPKSTLSP